MKTNKLKKEKLTFLDLEEKDESTVYPESTPL
jgi:hypothetical protein